LAALAFGGGITSPVYDTHFALRFRGAYIMMKSIGLTFP
jgi:hypothetical protein